MDDDTVAGQAAPDPTGPVPPDGARLYERLLALSRAAVRVQQARTPDAVLAALGSELRAIHLDWHYAVFDPVEDALRIRAVSLNPTIVAVAERLLGVQAVGLRLPIDSVELLRTAIRQRRAAYANGPAAIAQVFPGSPAALTRQICRIIGASGFIAAPLLVRGEVRGTLTVWAEDLGSGDLPAVVTFAQQAAMTLDNAQLLVELRTERQRLEEVFQQAPALIAALRGPNHVFVSANALFLRAIGRESPAEVLGRPAQEALPDLIGQGFRALLDQVYASGEPFIGRELPARLDRLGTGELEEGYFTFAYQPYRDASGQVAGILVHANEVTDLVRARRHAETLAAENAELYQAARKEERRQAFLAEASAVLASSLDYEATIRRAAHLAVPTLADLCVVDLRDADGILRRVAAAHVDSHTEADVQALAATYPPGWEANHPVGQVIASGKPLLVTEVAEPLAGEIRREEGANYLAISRMTGAESYLIVPLRLPETEAILGTLALARTTPQQPYTERDVLLAEELARRVVSAIDHARLYRSEHTARAHAEQAIQEQDDFLSVAAHELKTPVTSLRGFAQVLSRRLKRTGHLDAEHTRAILAQIERQSVRLTQLMEHLLDVSRLQAGQLRLDPGPVDLTRLVREIVEAAGTRAEHRRISLDAPPRLHCTLDALRVEQVLVNLLDNALKYSPPDAPIGVTVAAATASGDAREVQVAVRDHGAGIPLERRAHIFERFYRAHVGNHVQGLGLSLYLSRQIAELHGGCLDAEFPADGGARFVLRIPTNDPEVSTV